LDFNAQQTGFCLFIESNQHKQSMTKMTKC